MVPQRILGSTGLRVSEIGLGAWQLGGDWGPITEDRAWGILQAADQAGVNFWDTADVYGGGQSEEFIGSFKQAHPGIDRVIATKAGRSSDLYPDGYSEKALRDSIEQSRDRLQVERVDLLQLHCIPHKEIQRGRVFEWLQVFQQEGLIAHYGASVETVEEAIFCLQHTSVESLQIIINVLRQDMAEQVLPQAAEQQVGIIVRLGLASGLLSGTMTKNRQFSAQDHRNYNRDGQAFHVGETFSGLPFELGLDLAEQLKNELPEGISLPKASLRWLLDFEAVSTVITGASQPQQILRNAEASALPELSADLHIKLADFYHSQVRQHIRGVI
ncbi:MAG: aldo/keto reductase [Arenicella sp.]|nr:aldo/keto reductase [Arenicella sp.]